MNPSDGALAHGVSKDSMNEGMAHILVNIAISVIGGAVDSVKANQLHFSFCWNSVRQLANWTDQCSVEVSKS